jgi:hypothetical protein
VNADDTLSREVEVPQPFLDLSILTRRVAVLGAFLPVRYTAGDSSRVSRDAAIVVMMRGRAARAMIRELIAPHAGPV